MTGETEKTKGFLPRMNRFVRNVLFGGLLSICASGTASANQLQVFVTVGQIQAAAASAFSAQCSGALGVDCGVWAVAFMSGTTASGSATSGVGSVSPDSTGTDKWISSTVLGYNGFKIGGTASGNTGEEFITSSTHTVGNTYTGNVGSTNLVGVAPLNASTQIGFVLTFAANIAANTSVDIAFQFLASRLNGTTGAELEKQIAGSATITGLTLVELPEPSSIILQLSGLGLMGLAASWRRLRKR